MLLRENPTEDEWCQVWKSLVNKGSGQAVGWRRSTILLAYGVSSGHEEGPAVRARRLNQLAYRRPNPVCIPGRRTGTSSTPATLADHLPTSRPRYYPSDTSDAEWAILAPHVPAGTGRGRPIIYPRRDVVDAIRYLDRTGCQWDALPAPEAGLPLLQDLVAWRSSRTWSWSRRRSCRCVGSVSPG
jgi:hypothetical protein